MAHQSHLAGSDPEGAVRYCTPLVGRDGPSFTVETRVDGPAVPCVVVFNGGSSSIRFAVYEAGDTLRRRLDGKVDRIGAADATFTVSDPAGTPRIARHQGSAGHSVAVGALLDWLETLPIFSSIMSAGHRVVHGLQHFEPEPVTPALLAELSQIVP